MTSNIGSSAATLLSHLEASEFTPQPSLLTSGNQDLCQVDSFYLDSSGKVQVALPLQLAFSSEQALQDVLASNCIQPKPSNWKTDIEDGESNTASDKSSCLLSIEERVKMTFGASEAVTVTVESVTIESTQISEEHSHVLLLNVVSNLRVAKQGEIVSSVPGVKINLEASAMFMEKEKTLVVESTNELSEVERERQALAKGFRALYSGASATTNAESTITRTKVSTPIVFRVDLLHAFTVSARTMTSPMMGESLISVEVGHSDAHKANIKIHNIALHAAFSKPITDPKQKLDMSQNVAWRFMEGPEMLEENGKFPKTLQPHESYSTILYVKAEEDTMSQTYNCPITVVGSVTDTQFGKVSEIQAVTVAEWSSSKKAMEPSNAFRIDFDLPDPGSVEVGKIFTVGMSIYNLSDDQQNLKVLAIERSAIESVSSVQNANDDEKKDEDLPIKFEAPDLMDLMLGDDVKNRLLVVDDSCNIGSVDGHKSVEGKMRFMPLKPGILLLPYFDLVSLSSNEETVDSDPKEKQASLLYRSLHNLQVVAK